MNANGKRRSQMFMLAGWRERVVKLDPDTNEEVEAYAELHKLAINNALADLVELGLESLRQDKLRATAEIVKLRDQRRIAAIARTDSDEFDWSKDCYGCGKRGLIRRISGHYQCTACGCVTQTCCDL